MYLAVDQPTSASFGAILGVAVGLTVFRWFTPNDVFPVTYRRGKAAHLDVGGARGEAIVRAAKDQLGLDVIAIKPVGLEGSGGSTPLRMTVATPDDEPDRYVFAKLYAKNHVRADRWYKLGRTILYGALEDETPFGTVRRFVEYEDYTLRLMYDEGLPAPKPYGIVEITPEREYMIVMEFFDDAVEIGDAEVSDHVIDEGLELVRRMWDIGLAHRDIKPANLMVQGDELRLIDVFFVQVRPSPWRQAVDLANMMMVLALRSDAPRVYEHALRYFTPDEIGEAFAATRGVASPTQLRSLMKQHGVDLVARVPRARPTPPADPDPAVERPPRRPDALGAVAGAPRRGPGRLELERVRMSRRMPSRDARRRDAAGAARRVHRRRRRPDAAAAPTSTTACSSCSPSRCRRRPSSRACPSSRRAGRSAAPTSRRGSAASGSTRTGAGSMPSRSRSVRRATPRTPIEERPAPDEAATRVFVRPDSLSPSFTGVRFLRFEGGCIAYTFRFASDASSTLAIEAIEALSLLPRATVVAEVQDDRGAHPLRGRRAPVRRIASADVERPSPGALVRTRAARLAGFRPVRGRDGIRCRPRR